MAALRRLLAWLLLAAAGTAWAVPPIDPAPDIAGCSRPLGVDAVQRQAGTDQPAQEVRLPDTLSREERRDAIRLVYRLDVTACQGHPAAGLWLFRVGAPYTVTDDSGQALRLLSTRTQLPLRELFDHQVSRREQTWNGRIPALFALEPGTRVVTLRLQAPTYLPYGLVGAEVGPVQAMLEQQARAMEHVVAYADAASGVVLVIGLLAGVLWLQRRSGTSLLWLAVACALWGIRGLAYFDHGVLGPAVAFEQLNPLNVLLSGASITLCVLSLLGLDDLRTRIGLGLTCAACSALLLLSVLTERGVVLSRTLAFGSTFCMLGVALVVVLRARRRLHPAYAPLVAAGLAGLLACATHDMLVVGGRLPPDSPSIVFWGFIALLVGFATMTGHFVVRTLRRAEQSNLELERAIAAKTSQLEASYALLRDAERERAQVQAREHLLREMHDGIGAQLMTTLRGMERAALSPDQVREALQDGLDELRLLMDSGDIGRTLAGALAAWRHRWDPRLDAVGLALDWQVEPALEDVVLEPEAVLQVMRILQEAVTNVVKHAQARRVRVLVSHAPVQQQLQLEVSDDGVGLPSEGPGSGRGRGLPNMQTRAQVLGGRLTVQGLPGGGSVVRLLVPVAAAETVRT